MIGHEHDARLHGTKFAENREKSAQRKMMAKTGECRSGGGDSLERTRLQVQNREFLAFWAKKQACTLVLW
jgi:hypothetical protein